jgi:hypothetical protein
LARVKDNRARIDSLESKLAKFERKLDTILENAKTMNDTKKIHVGGELM